MYQIREENKRTKKNKVRRRRRKLSVTRLTLMCAQHLLLTEGRGRKKKEKEERLLPFIRLGNFSYKVFVSNNFKLEEDSRVEDREEERKRKEDREKGLKEGRERRKKKESMFKNTKKWGKNQ